MSKKKMALRSGSGSGSMDPMVLKTSIAVMSVFGMTVKDPSGSLYGPKMSELIRNGGYLSRGRWIDGDDSCEYHPEPALAEN